jgi:hypothetical protein
MHDADVPELQKPGAVDRSENCLTSERMPPGVANADMTFTAAPMIKAKGKR